MNKQRTNKLYNFIVNTYGLSKEVIMDCVETRLEGLVDKHVQNVLQSERLTNMIMDRVAYYIKNGTIDQCRSKNCFEDVVKQQVKSAVEDQLKKNCEIKFKFLPNSIQFIKEKDNE